MLIRSFSCISQARKMALIDLGDMRKAYKGANEGFDVKDLASKNPIEQFTDWFEQAKLSEGIHEPNAMAIATATKDGVPSVRMVLLKGYGEDGFRFFTNYTSRKGQELNENPRASLMFFWEPMMASIRIEGTVEKISEEESTNYFQRRPKESQIGASLSEQSTVIEGRHVLTELNAHLKEKYADSEVLPKPEHWGGYLVRPHTIEFWQGQTTRLHDRIRFRKPAEGEAIDSKLTHQGEKGWVYERLAP